jgi:hypothetical protein
VLLEWVEDGIGLCVCFILDCRFVGMVQCFINYIRNWGGDVDEEN